MSRHEREEREAMARIIDGEKMNLIGSNVKKFRTAKVLNVSLDELFDKE